MGRWYSVTYTLFKYNERSFELLPWIFLFDFLSTEEFAAVYDRFNFPFYPCTHFRQVTLGFMFAYGNISHNRNAIPPPGRVDLWTVIKPLNYAARKQALFHATFQHLDELGVGKEVYSWVLESREYQFYLRRFQKLESYNKTGNLLREWATELLALDPDIRGMPQTPAAQSVVEEWFERRNRWLSHWEVHQITTRFYDLPTFSTPTKRKLVEIILEIGVREQDISKMHKRLEERIGGKYALFSLEGSYQCDMAVWSAVQKTLSHTEMAILEEWLLRKRIGYMGLTLPSSHE